MNMLPRNDGSMVEPEQKVSRLGQVVRMRGYGTQRDYCSHLPARRVERSYRRHLPFSLPPSWIVISLRSVLSNDAPAPRGERGPVVA